MVSRPWGRTQKRASLISASISVSIQTVILSPRMTLWVTTSLSIGLGDCAEMLVAFNETRAKAAIRTIASGWVMTCNVRELFNEWGGNVRGVLPRQVECG